MKELIFLKKLRARNCLESSRILFKNQLYENSTSEAYYCIYNSLLALLFKAGIKSENHSATIIIFEKLFDNKELAKTALWAKKERIDKQYYVETKQVVRATRESCSEMIMKSKDFLLNIRIVIDELNSEKIRIIRESFDKIFS